MGIRVLGASGVQGDGRLRPRDRRLLEALTVRRGAAVSPEQVADALWGDAPPSSWAKQVQICVSRLRKVLGPDAIVTTEDGYRLDVASEEIDVARFEVDVARARQLASSGDPQRAAAALNRALALWQGEPFERLDGWGPAAIEAARLTELHRSAEEDLLEMRLAIGEHREVATAAEALVAEEPLRERRWALLALAQYRCERQADALRTLQAARRHLGENLGIAPGPQLVELEASVLRQDPALAPAPAPSPIADECPYMGLAPYDARDAERFHGRTADIDACLARLRGSPLLIVTGASGCGKSSLVRAGLVPALRRAGHPCVVVLPGPDPEGSLAAALASAPTPGAIVVVDQFEEVADGGLPTDVVRRFCANLAARAQAVAPVIVAVRADRFAGLAVDESFSRLAEQGLHLMTPLVGDELREAIERPAHDAGLRLESGLVGLLVSECEDEPGALPLLSHALVETWRRRDGPVLTVEGYRASGGIQAAVARSADQLHDSLSGDERAVLRSTMLRLVTPSPEGDPVRCRLPSRTLREDPARDRILSLLVHARLVTAQEETIEIAHEALARAWPRLRAWLDEDESGLRILRHLAPTAQGWDELGRPDSELYRGPRLGAALEWRDGAESQLTEVERDFLDASAAREGSEAAALRAEAERRRHESRRLRATMAVIGVLLVVSLAAGVLARQGRLDARDQRDAAQSARLDAHLEALVNRSLALRSTNRAEAALLAVEAYRRQPDARSFSALLGTFTASHGFVQYLHLPAGAEILAAAALPGTDEVAIALTDGSLAVMSLSGSGGLREIAPATPNLQSHALVRVTPDGRHLAALHVVDPSVDDRTCMELEVLAVTDDAGCASLSVYAVDTGRRILGPVEPPVGPGDLAIDPTGRHVAVAGGYQGDVVVYALADGVEVGRLTGLPRPADATNVRDTGTVAFDQDGTLLTASLAGPIRRIDPTTTAVLASYEAPSRSAHNHLVVTDQGLVVGGGDEGLVAIDARTGERRWAIELTSTDTWPCPFMAVTTATDRLYCGSYFGSIEERDLGTGERTARTLDPQLGSVGDLAVADGGRELLTFGERSSVITRWRLDGTGAIAELVAPGQALVGGYDPSGRSMLTADLETLFGDAEDFAIWDPATGRPSDPVDLEIERLGPHGPAWVAPDRIAVRTPRGAVELYDLSTRDLVPGTDLPADTAGSFLTADGSWYLSRFDGTVQAHDPATGRPTGHTLRLDGPADWLAAPSTGGMLVATTFVAGQGLTSGTYDHTGALISGPVPHLDVTTITADGTAMLGSEQGAITEFDAETFQPVASFPGAKGFVQMLQLSGDSRLLAAPSADGTISVYDVATRVRLGDPISVLTPDLPPGAIGVTTGMLRPDGRAVAINTAAGVVVWDLDPDTLVTAACRLAGRDLTETEWQAHMAAFGERRRTCSTATG